MTKSKQNRAPTHRLYVVKGEGEQTRWTEVGAAWPNRDGHGFSIMLDAVPLGGRLVLREIADSEETGGQS